MVERLKEKVYFVRVAPEVYKHIEKLGNEEQRSITNMANVLLGYALNRYPEGIGETQLIIENGKIVPPKG